jgi:hypothetical protein
LPDYYAAKLEADEYFTALAARRREMGDADFQGIVVRPGTLSDEPGVGKVSLGHTRVGGKVSREDVAAVSDALLAREDTRGWKDLVPGDVPVEEAVEKVTHPHVCAFDGEDLDAIRQRFKGELDTFKMRT